jgi:hypothetical protein
MKTSGVVEKLMAKGLVRGPQDIERYLDVMKETGAVMRMDDLRELVGSIAPDMVDELLSQQMTATMLLETMKWPETWHSWVTREQTHFLTTQYIERVDQLGMLGSLEESGDRYAELGAPSAKELSYTLGGFGNILGVDLRTIRSDRLKYFDKLGEAMGRSAMSRLHYWLYITMLQANPTLTEDSNALFDNTNHVNDCDTSGVGKPPTYPNMRAAFRKLDAAVDGASEPLTNEGFVIVGGAYWRSELEELAENPERNDTGNHARNMLKPRIKGVDISRKLGYDWYVVAKDLAGLLINFLDGKEKPEFKAESDDSSYKFETDKSRFRIGYWFGGVHQRAIPFVRGSQNVLAS